MGIRKSPTTTFRIEKSERAFLKFRALGVGYASIAKANRPVVYKVSEASLKEGAGVPCSAMPNVSRKKACYAHAHNLAIYKHRMQAPAKATLVRNLLWDEML